MRAEVGLHELELLLDGVLRVLGPDELESKIDQDPEDCGYKQENRTMPVTQTDSHRQLLVGKSKLLAWSIQ